MSVQAKVRCVSNFPGGPYQNPEPDAPRMVRFTCVYDSDPNHPNFEWAQATPSGYFEMFVSNPDAYDRFEVGQEYLVTFDPA